MARNGQRRGRGTVGHAVIGLGHIAQTAVLPAFQHAKENSRLAAVALPNTLHAECAIRAARAGAHVLTEKPMATSEADCRRMIEAAEESGVKLMVAYRLHFDPANLDAVEAIRSGRIGEPRFFTSEFSYQLEPGNIRGDARTGAVSGEEEP